MGDIRRFSVGWAAAARGDLLTIVERIAERDMGSARRIADKIERCAGTLMTLPLRGRVVPELAAIGVHSYRELILPPWRLVYRVTEDIVRVVLVVDGRRNVEDVLFDRLIR